MISLEAFRGGGSSAGRVGSGRKSLSSSAGKNLNQDMTGVPVAQRLESEQEQEEGGKVCGGQIL